MMGETQAIRIITRAVNIATGSGVFQDPKDLAVIYQALAVISPENEVEKSTEPDTVETEQVVTETKQEVDDSGPVKTKKKVTTKVVKEKA